MNWPLKQFKVSYLELLLNFIWRQWSTLGVSGYGEGEDRWAIDPEALLLFTCTMGRYEPRLFDEVLDWLDLNGRFINVQRLKTIIKKEDFQGRDIMAAIAGIMSRRAAMRKWGRLAETIDKEKAPENLFYKKDGEPMPSFGEVDRDFIKYGFRRGPLKFRGYSKPVRTAPPAGLIYKLRSFLGVNARCEIMLYLLTHESGHPSRIAREAYYYQKTIQDTLIDMTFSGLVQVRSQGREKHYWLKPEQWSAFLPATGEFPAWITWAPFFSALEKIWLKLNQPELLTLDPLLQSSELRKLIREVKPDIQRAGFAGVLSDDSAYPGEKYTAVFLSDISSLLEY